MNTGRGVASAAHPPLYSTYLGLWSTLGIDTVTGHRLASSLLGIAAVAVIGLLGYRLAGPPPASSPPASPRSTRSCGSTTACSCRSRSSSSRSSSRCTPCTASGSTRHCATPVVLGAVVRRSPRSVATSCSCCSRSSLIPLALRRARHRLARRGSAWRSWPASRARSSSCRGRSVNLTRFDEPTLTSSSLGSVLSAANCDSVYYGEHDRLLRQLLPRPVAERGSTSPSATRCPATQAIEYMKDHVTRLPVGRARARRPRVGRVQAGADHVVRLVDRAPRARPVVDRAVLLLRCSCRSPVVGLVGLWRRRISILPLLAGAAHRHVRRRHDLRRDPLPRAGRGAIVLAAAVGIVATVGWLRGRRPARPPATPRIADGAAGTLASPMTAGDPAARDPARRGRARAQHRAARGPSCPNHRLVDAGLPPLALRREPVRARDPAPGRRRTASAVAHYAMIPQRYRGRRRRGPRRLLAARGRAHRHPAARALPQLGHEVDRRRGGGRLAVRHRRVQRQVDRHRREVPGLEDARARSRCSSASPMHRGRGVASTRSTTRSAPATTSPTSPPGSTTSPSTQWTNSYTHRVPALAARAARTRRTRCTSTDDLVARHAPPTRRFGVRAAVILKLLPRDGARRRRSPPTRSSAPRAASTARRTRSTPGFNEHVRGPRRATRRDASSRRRCTSSCGRSRPTSTRRRCGSTPSSSSTWTRTDGRSGHHVHPRPRGPPPVTGSPRSATPRSPARSSSSSTTARVRGTFFVVGEIAERPSRPRRARSPTPATRSASTAGATSRSPSSTPTRSRADGQRGKDLLEELAGTPVVGFRAPTFSLVPESRWAVDVLADAGFTYSSSVLPARNPLFGDPTAADHAVPLAQRPGRAAVPGRARRRPRPPLPRRRVPARAPHAGRPTARAAPVGSDAAAVDLLPPVRLRPRRAVLGRARGRSARQPAALVQPPPHVRQGRRAAPRPASAPPLGERIAALESTGPARVDAAR